MKGKQEVLNALERFGQSVKRHSPEIPYEVKTKVIQRIIKTGSIDTTKFIQAVNFHEDRFGDIGFRVDASDNNSVTYDGFVEVDHFNTWSGETIQGRYNYRDGIETSDFRPIFDEMADDGFRF